MATHEQAPAAHEPIVNESVPQEEEASAPVAVDIPVRFAETDAMGVVHHSAYIVWFEAGRIAWMAAAGMPYTEIAAAGRHFAVTAIHAEYRHAARFGDTVRVVTRLAKLRSRFVEFVYDVLNAADGSLLARGSSEHVCVDLDGRMAKIPDAIVERLHAGAQALATA
jgi:acyl-CoA thioester hydrolase